MDKTARNSKLRTSDATFKQPALHNEMDFSQILKGSEHLQNLPHMATKLRRNSMHRRGLRRKNILLKPFSSSRPLRSLMYSNETFVTNSKIKDDRIVAREICYNLGTMAVAKSRGYGATPGRIQSEIAVGSDLFTKISRFRHITADHSHRHRYQTLRRTVALILCIHGVARSCAAAAQILPEHWNTRISIFLGFS